MTNEEKELTITYLTEMQEEYIEGEGYERHPLPEYYALDMAIEALEQELTPIKNERPTKCGNYLVQVASTDGTATIDYFDVDHFNGDGTWTHYTVGDTKKVSKNIVAWMHLPKMVKVGEVNDKRRRT